MSGNFDEASDLLKKGLRMNCDIHKLRCVYPNVAYSIAEHGKLYQDQENLKLGKKQSRKYRFKQVPVIVLKVSRVTSPTFSDLTSCCVLDCPITQRLLKDSSTPQLCSTYINLLFTNCSRVLNPFNWRSIPMSNCKWKIAISLALVSAGAA